VERNKEAAIVLDCGIHRGGEAIGIDPVAVGFIITLIAWVVDEDGI
jgi:hypothetical protein